MIGSVAAGAFVGTLVFGVGHRLPRRLTFISSLSWPPWFCMWPLL
jgi:hypothetical protein